MYHQLSRIKSVIIGMLLLGLLLTGCADKNNSRSDEEKSILDQTSAVEFSINDYYAVHAVDAADPNKFLIFGNLPSADPASDLSPELAVFLGRWEGYSFAPPVKKDRKAVFNITEISQQGGKAYGWSGTNIQFPDLVQEIQFGVVNDGSPAIEWQFALADGSLNAAKFTYNKESNTLSGVITDSVGNITDGPYELTRDKNFYVYQDYVRFLESKRITTQTYKDSQLLTYGKGYMLYLPEGYDTELNKNWPLLFFLHGYGDRGTNLLVLAKASPFMYIREKGPLPFIIVAPLLDSEGDTNTFPNEYMDGALAEIKAKYRVDEKRMYLTGLSMGGEGTWKFALHQPDQFAAIAPLCGYFNGSNPDTLKPIKDLPVWAIHGADDTVVPLKYGRDPVDALQQAGGSVKFTILDGHDHDVWTDTYSNRAIYDWLMQYQKP